MQTQCERLLEHLQKHGSINPMQAWRKLGIYRLGARVFDLRQRGHKIGSSREKVVNQFGEQCLVSKYEYGRTDASSNLG